MVMVSTSIDGNKQCLRWHVLLLWDCSCLVLAVLPPSRWGSESSVELRCCVPALCKYTCLSQTPRRVCFLHICPYTHQLMDDVKLHSMTF